MPVRVMSRLSFRIGSVLRAVSDMSWHRNRGNRHYGGGRGGFYSRRNDGSETADEDQTGRRYGRPHSDRPHSGGRHSGRPHSGRPPGLRGKDIGLYYAKMGKEKRNRKELEQRSVVSMGEQQEHDIRRLLDNIQAADNVPPQPPRSGASIENEDSTSSSEEMSFPPMDPHPSGSQTSDVDPPHSAHRWNSSRGNDSLKITLDVDSRRKVSASECASNIKQESTLSLPEKRNGDNTEVEGLPNLEEVMLFNREEADFHFTDEMKETSVQGSQLCPDENLNKLYTQEHEEKQSSPRYQKMMDFRRTLPSYNMREEIVKTVNENQVIVISGETGCGKTTQVPQFILDSFIEKGQGSSCRIICTQPRRISAVSVAERVANERDEALGNSVGYVIRLENQFARRQGSILFCTTGIVLKYIESDPQLLQASHIVIDEIHERDLLSDFLMIILKDLVQKRPDLKIILMSATLNAQQFSKYFNNCPCLHIPGFTYPVKEYYLEDVLEMTRYEPPHAQKSFKPKYGRRHREMERERQESEWNFDVWSRNLRGEYSNSTINSLQRMDKELIDFDLVHSVIRHIVLKMDEGAILVFVPGWTDISNVNDRLLKDNLFKSDKFKIFPLHSMMPTINQKQIFEKPPPGVRKVIIATNIAETSITIDDVVFVVDCGKIKVKDFEPEFNLTTLQSQWVSRANAKQRRGRAGRVQAGHCFHLYTRLQESELRSYLPAEMLRTRLEELCLQIKLLKLGNIQKFVSKAIEPPSMEALAKAVEVLQDLQALDCNEELLPLGVHLARMPVDPHSGKMLLFSAMFGCLDPITTVAASLSFKDAFVIPLGKERLADEKRKQLADGCKSDHIMLIKAFENWERTRRRGTNRQFCWDYFLSENTLKLLENMKKQFAQVLFDIGFVGSSNPKDPVVNYNSGNHKLVKAVLCAGLYPNIAHITKVPNPRSRRKGPVKLKLKDQQKVSIHLKSVNATETEFDSAWMIYHKMMKTTSVSLFDCSTVSPFPLLFFGGSIETGTSTLDGVEMPNITVDGWISFWAKPEIASLVQELRRQLDKILEDKITNPSISNLNPKTKEGAIFRAIIELITTDEPNPLYKNVSQSRDH